MGSANFNLEKNAYFKKLDIISRSDLHRSKIDKYGDRIILELPIEDIKVRPQIRKTFDEENIARLAIDISRKGLIHPITVMHDPENRNKYILLIGGNRYCAFLKLKRKLIPAIVKPFTENSVDIKLIQLSENLHRSDINPIELADALMSLKKESNYTLEEIAISVGRNIDSIKQYSRISKLGEEEKNILKQNKSTKNEILKYLSKKRKLKAEPEYCDGPILNQEDKLELKPLVIYKRGKNKDSKQDLKNKIAIAQQFIEQANKLLPQPTLFD